MIETVSVRAAPSLSPRTFWIANLAFWLVIFALGYLGGYLIDREPTVLWRSMATDAGGFALTFLIHRTLMTPGLGEGAFRIGFAIALSVFAAIAYAVWAWTMVYAIAPDPASVASTAASEPAAISSHTRDVIVRWALWSLWPFLAWTAGYLGLTARAAPTRHVDRDDYALELLQRQLAEVSAPDRSPSADWFWGFNIAFWLGVALISMISTLVQSQPFTPLRSLGLELVGFVLAGLIHAILVRLEDRPMPQRAAAALALCVPAVVAYAAAIVASYAGEWASDYMTKSGAEPDPMTARAAWRELEMYRRVLPRLVFLNLWFFVAWAGLYLAFDYARRAQRSRENLLRAAKMTHDAQLGMLRFQLNPHFLFNTLNAISTLVLEKRVEEAESMIGRLSLFLRATLDADQTATVPLADEIATQRLYLDIEQVRFGERLQVGFTIEDGAETVRAPGFILQPLIENAIKHGMPARSGRLNVAITARREGADLVVSVVDDGARAPVRSGAGVGLSNVADRLRVLYGERGVLLAGPRPEGGFAATIRLPWQDRHKEHDHARPAG